MFTETEAGQALREIRARDPVFDMVAFLRMLRRARAAAAANAPQASPHSACFAVRATAPQAAGACAVARAVLDPTWT